MPDPACQAVILAAGKGTRMISTVPKVLHAVGGLSLIGHVLRAAAAAGIARPAVVVAPGMEDVSAEVRTRCPDASVHIQLDQRGTADALLAAREVLTNHRGDVIVLYGDTPFIRPETLQQMIGALDGGANVAVLGFVADDPTGYGRLICDERGNVLAIREEQDASPRERAITLCNGGIMGFRCPDLLAMLGRIGTANAKNERYLTDIVGIARSDGLKVVVVTCPESEVMGVNSRQQLATAESIFQARARTRAMAAGTTLIAPETVWFAYDTVTGRDVRIEPNVFFGPGCILEDEVEILANSHLVGAHVRKGARVGPFARIRPGSEVGAGAHVGNFVELKNTRMAQGAKANHLAYVGDSRIGADANIGAGTIFCNYDGFNKQVTENVPADALALGRAEQQVRLGWAERFRARRGKRTQDQPARGGINKPRNTV
jgi:bifunctional UDP-N-acetylglucosamine pyrophosphorylase / glucosamine-1-phosphate N-acetyltransferase